jgi:murein DD-endopeptidase MepM/ murein hydrolase activator NlpD
MIQHNQDLISVYKHCSLLLKKQGESVKAGEAIALAGKSGTLAHNNPHLHFELWRKGKAINPETLIVF